MEIVTLIENSSGAGDLIGEFGLSLLGKSDETSFLFDMGQSDRFVRNALLLNEKIEDVDFAVLSHGHYDHGAGVPFFFENNDEAMVYLAQTAGGDYFANIAAKFPRFLLPVLPESFMRMSTFTKYIGLDKKVLKDHQERFAYIEGTEEIVSDFFLLTEIDQGYPLAQGNKFLLEKGEQGLRSDTFSHEMLLVVREEDGLILFTGCGHKGVLNMVKTAKNHFRDTEIKAVVGGFHLAYQPGKHEAAGTAEEIEELGMLLQKEGVKSIYTGHCTGGEASRILREVYGDHFTQLQTGLRFII